MVAGRALLALAPLLLLPILAGCGNQYVGAPAGDQAWIAEAMATPEFEAACAATPGCMDPDPLASAPTEPIWRAKVVRDGSGKVRIAEIDSVEVTEGDGVPSAPNQGIHALVALDATGKVLAGQLLAFPQELRFEYADGQSPTHVDLSGKTTDTLAYVRALPGVVTLAVHDRDGNTLHSVDAPQERRATGARSPQQGGIASRLGRMLGLGEAYAQDADLDAPGPPIRLPSHCAHVIILQGEHNRWYLADHMAAADLVVPGPRQLAATRAALMRMTPLLCQSIGRIAFGGLKEGSNPKGIGGIVSSAAGDLILVNTDFDTDFFTESTLSEEPLARFLLQHTLIHEAGHAATFLLGTRSKRGGEHYEGRWIEAASDRARKVIENTRLDKGLEVEWARLHGSFEAHGWAGAYCDSTVEGDAPPPYCPGAGNGNDKAKPTAAQQRALLAKQAIEAGMMSGYSTRNVKEDIAETLANAYLTTVASREIPARNRTDQGCMQARASPGRSLAAEQAALYTKLLLLQHLELIDSKSVRDCLANKAVLTITDPGIHVWQADKHLRSFKDKTRSDIGPRGEYYLFQFEASGQAGFGGKEHPARLHLQLDVGKDEVEFISYPRGIYALAPLNHGRNNFTLTVEGVGAADMHVSEGYALVTEGTKKRIAGSIFAARSVRPFAPIPLGVPGPLPVRHDPPLAYRFLVEP